VKLKIKHFQKKCPTKVGFQMIYLRIWSVWVTSSQDHIDFLNSTPYF